MCALQTLDARREARAQSQSRCVAPRTAPLTRAALRSLMSTDQATTSALGARFVAAREQAATFESEQMLANLGERLFGVPAEPLKLGRFSVLRRIGAGGMGVVYLGYDAELDRKIALKLLRLRSADSDGHASARLVREARALARVDHPHVIAVHEVGSHDGAVFLAMDLVEGASLEVWQRERPRPWRALVELYIQAGRGLAAAHAAGVVHRDFKPANVLVGDDGRGGLRARVVDFGLARAAEEEGDEDEPASVARDPPRPREADADGVGPDGALTSELTATGALLGTPAYMAPEQLLGHRADARSDQFSFALALHEALCGQRAFAGDSIDALRDAVLAGHRRPSSAARRGPRWLHRILDRALERAPERRHPSMQALLDELERGLLRRRRLGLIAGALVLSLGAAFVGSRSAAPSLCARGAEAIAQVWGEPARAATQAAFLATDKPFAAHAWAQTEAQLDAYAAGWVAMYGEACEATQVRGDQSGEALDLRMRCLDRRRDELAALLEVFAVADERTVMRALEASDALTPVASCADLDALASAHAVPEDPRLREPVAALRGELVKARALRHAGHYDEAFALSEAADARARALDYAPLRAESGLLLGSLQGLRGAASEAAVTLDRAFLDALACDHPDVALWAAITATHAVGYVGRRAAEGRRWGELAEPLLERVGRDARAAASLYGNLGTIEVNEGAFDEARARFEAAIAIAEAGLGGDDIVIANASANLASVYRRIGDHPQALAHYRRAGQIFTARLGADHPTLAKLTNSTGTLLQEMGDLEGAARSYRAVLALAGGSLSPTSPTLGHAHNNLAEVLLLQDHPADALPHAEAAVAIWSAAHGEGHPLVGQALVGLGRIHIALADADPALRALQRALEILQATKAAAPTLAGAQFELARALVLVAPGDLDEAIATAQTAAAALEPGEEREKIVAWLGDLAGP